MSRGVLIKFLVFFLLLLIISSDVIKKILKIKLSVLPMTPVY
jgi:hypothetical protein